MPRSGHKTSGNFTVMAARRIWSVAEKRAIVGKMARSGANMSAIAREHGVAQSLLYRWRKELAAADHGVPQFLPVALAAPQRPTTIASPLDGLPLAARIEIVLANGRAVRVGVDVDTAALVRIVAALEGAE